VTPRGRRKPPPCAEGKRRRQAAGSRAVRRPAPPPPPAAVRSTAGRRAFGKRRSNDERRRLGPGDQSWSGERRLFRSLLGAGKRAVANVLNSRKVARRIGKGPSAKLAPDIGADLACRQCGKIP